uniref:Reverse transcriptase domain-containing protein n=1 Tax=Knipowitschia caucasica TaxID=637954 RepID=A0AAV2L3V6_KNICA
MKSHNNIVHLRPVYTPIVHREPATPRLVQRWTVECEDRLRDCFNCTLWDELCDHGDDINAITECITDYINFCCEIAVPSKMVRCFSNNKPWMNIEIKALLKEKKRAFLSKDKQALKEVQRRLRLSIRTAKARYKNRMEEQLSQQNVAGVWRSLKTISGFKTPPVQPVGDPHAFNTIQLRLLRDKLETAGVDYDLSQWILDYLTDRPQFVRTKDFVSEVLTCSVGALQGTVLAPFLFTLYTADFRRNTDGCVLQKFSDDSAIIRLSYEDDDAEYRGGIQDFVDWCQRNHLLINARKTKEMNHLLINVRKTKEMNHLLINARKTKEMNHLLINVMKTKEMNYLLINARKTKEMNHLLINVRKTKEMNHLLINARKTKEMNHLLINVRKTKEMNHLLINVMKTKEMNHLLINVRKTKEMNHLLINVRKTKEMNHLLINNAAAAGRRCRHDPILQPPQLRCLFDQSSADNLSSLSAR